MRLRWVVKLNIEVERWKGCGFLLKKQIISEAPWRLGVARPCLPPASPKDFGITVDWMHQLVLIGCWWYYALQFRYNTPCWSTDRWSSVLLLLLPLCTPYSVDRVLLVHLLAVEWWLPTASHIPTLHHKSNITDRSTISIGLEISRATRVIVRSKLNLFLPIQKKESYSANHTESLRLSLYGKHYRGMC